MTEAEWLASDWARQILSPFASLSSRKLRLFACACCRRISHLVGDEQFDEAIATLERYADGLAKEAERVRLSNFEFKVATGGSGDAKHFARYLIQGAARKTIQRQADRLGVGAVSAIANAIDSPQGHAEEGARQMNLLRDVLGNPFRPILLDPAWKTLAVVALAQAAYDNSILPTGTLDLDRLAVLADALEDVGCTNPAILDHLRGPGPHVRGCWCVDLILDKQ